jgi:hypothetical protein
VTHRFFIYNHQAQDFLRPGTALLWFSSEDEAKLHLERLPREDVAAGRYTITSIAD